MNEGIQLSDENISLFKHTFVFRGFSVVCDCESSAPSSTDVTDDLVTHLLNAAMAADDSSTGINTALSGDFAVGNCLNIIDIKQVTFISYMF